jgi:hypothetical protein
MCLENANLHDGEERVCTEYPDPNKKIQGSATNIGTGHFLEGPAVTIEPNADES